MQRAKKRKPALKKTAGKKKTKKTAGKKTPKKTGKKTPPKAAPSETAATAKLWQIIAAVDRKSRGGSLEARIAAFRAGLDGLPDDELVAIEAAFCRLMQRSYDYNLWGAAYVIHGGCSDDAFWDFRAGLISLGERIFEAALANPDSLADVEDVEDRTIAEGFQYVPGALLEQRGLASRGGSHGMDGKPSGQNWVDQDLVQRLPRLVERFDFEAE